MWKDRSGRFEVEAQFLQLEDDQFLHLHKVNGVKIKVPVRRMAREDLEYVQDLLAKGSTTTPIIRLWENAGLPTPAILFEDESIGANGRCETMPSPLIEEDRSEDEDTTNTTLSRDVRDKTTQTDAATFTTLDSIAKWSSRLCWFATDVIADFHAGSLKFFLSVKRFENVMVCQHYPMMFGAGLCHAFLHVNFSYVVRLHDNASGFVPDNCLTKIENQNLDDDAFRQSWKDRISSLDEETHLIIERWEQRFEMDLSELEGPVVQIEDSGNCEEGSSKVDGYVSRDRDAPTTNSKPDSTADEIVPWSLKCACEDICKKYLASDDRFRSGHRKLGPGSSVFSLSDSRGVVDDFEQNGAPAAELTLYELERRFGVFERRADGSISSMSLDL